MNADKSLTTAGAADCLMPDRLWKAAAGLEVWTAAEAGHLRSCPQCRRRLIGLAQALHQPSGDAATLVATLLLAVVTRLARERVGRLAPAGVHFRTGPGRDLPMQRFTFDGGEGLAATLYLNSDGKHWLDVSHAALPAPSLVRVRLSEPGSSTSAWARFAVLRQSLSVPFARLLVDEGLSEQPLALAIDLVPSTAALTAGDAAGLRDSFAAAWRDDPAAVPAWKAWAVEELAQPDVPAGLRPVLEEIANDGVPGQHGPTSRLATVRTCPVETEASRFRQVG